MFEELKIRSTVKIHGTHADWNCKKIDDTWIVKPQSRNRNISTDNDNCGFAKFTENILSNIIELLNSHFENNNKVLISGEFAGKNIQKNVAIEHLSTFMTIFDICTDGVWLDVVDIRSFKQNEVGVYNIGQFPVKYSTINLEDPEKDFQKLVSYVSEIEKECPVGKFFGVTGIGEGIVCKLIGHNEISFRDEMNFYLSPSYSFKIKGDEHQVSKNKNSTMNIPKVNKNLNVFIKNNACDARFNQGFDYLREYNLPLDKTSVGKFIEWVRNDIFKEEYDDIKTLNIEEKLICKEINKAANSFYFKYIHFDHT